MRRRSYDATNWEPQSVYVDGSLDSIKPTWVMTARRGRMVISIASGPMKTRKLAESIARKLNDTDPLRWDYFFSAELAHVLNGDWG